MGNYEYLGIIKTLKNVVYIISLTGIYINFIYKNFLNSFIMSPSQ